MGLHLQRGIVDVTGTGGGHGLGGPRGEGLPADAPFPAEGTAQKIPD